MKKKVLSISMIVLLLIQICSCGADEKPTNALVKYNLSLEIQENIFTSRVLNQIGNLEDFLDLLSSNGMSIANGTAPPTIAADILKGDFGVRYNVTNRCVFDNKNPNNKGEIFGGFLMEIFINTEQSLSNTSRFKYSSISSSDFPEYPNGMDSGEGVGYSSGDGNNFTLFVTVENARFNNIPYKALWVLSGTYSNFLLTDFKNCFVILEKGPDPLDQLANPGTIRIFSDNDPNLFWD